MNVCFNTPRNLCFILDPIVFSLFFCYFLFFSLFLNLSSSLTQLETNNLIILNNFSALQRPIFGCFPFYQNPSFSSRRDLVITSVFYREKNLKLNLLSIRQSGCRATIVILIDTTLSLSPSTIFMINLVDAIVVQSSISPHLKLHTDMTRDTFLVNYLKKNRDHYDRVFFFDSFDCFFEHDVFEYFTEKKVYLFQESLVTINQDNCDKNWIINCYNKEALSIVGDKYFVCSGTVGSGSIDEMIKLYTILDAEDKWKVCRVDQGPLNYLLYTGKLKDKNLNYHVFSHVGPVLTLNMAIKNYFNRSGYMLVKNALNHTPAVIHQTKNFPLIQESLYKRCEMALIELNQSADHFSHFIRMDLNEPLNPRST